MAIGNMFQGMARGKVGDVVFAVREGKQVSRVRNRKPKNPQTNKQIMQRAIMATVLQAYSAGKEIFDHSFQGKSVGEQCARVFLSLNTNALRAAIAAEQLANTALENQKALVVLPKATKPVANAYIVSQGSYDQKFFEVTSSDNHLNVTVPAKEQAETVQSYATRLGLLPGDIYTIVVLGGGGDAPTFIVNGYTSEDLFATSFGGANFMFARLMVKSSFAAAEVANLGQIFEITKIKGFASNASVADTIISTAITANGTVIDLDPRDFLIGEPGAVSAGVIRSRLDSDLRSNTVLTQLNIENYGAEDWNTGGIVGGLAVQAWKQRTAQLGDSDLVLEGGDV